MADIFVLAQHRTGSTLLKNMLDAQPDVHMAFDEMNLFEPLRSNTLDRLIERGTDTPEKLVNAIYTGKVYGTFWQKFQESGIQRGALLQALESERPLSTEVVLRQVLRLLREQAGVGNSGVKYPVHVSRARWLLDNFPRSRVLFLFRNPLAVISSKINDDATRARKKKSLIHRFGVHYFTLFYFCLEFRRACSAFNANQDRVMKVSYEDLVSAPETTLRSICRYVGIDFHVKMLSATGKSSSYARKSFSGPVVASMTRYRANLSKLDRWLIRLLTTGPYKELM